MAKMCQFIKVLILVVAVNHAVNAQITQYDGFKIDGTEAIWQNIYDTALSMRDAEVILKSMTNVRNVSISDSMITADLVSMPMEYSKYGYSRGLTSMMILAYDVTGRIQIDFKPNRYRVTLFELYLEKKVSAALFQSGKFSESVLKNNRKAFRSSMASADVLGLYHKNFVDKFRMRQRVVKNKDW